jgi:hypothetical protein
MSNLRGVALSRSKRERTLLALAGLTLAAIVSIALIAFWPTGEHVTLLRAVDRSTGDLRWEVQLPDGGAQWIGYQGERLVVSVCRGAHRELLIDPDNGRIVGDRPWRGFGANGGAAVSSMGSPVSDELSFDRERHLLVSTYGWTMEVDPGESGWIPTFVGEDVVYVVDAAEACTGFD